MPHWNYPVHDLCPCSCLRTMTLGWCVSQREKGSLSQCVRSEPEHCSTFPMKYTFQLHQSRCVCTCTSVLVCMHRSPQCLLSTHLEREWAGCPEIFHPKMSYDYAQTLEKMPLFPTPSKLRLSVHVCALWSVYWSSVVNATVIVYRSSAFLYPVFLSQDCPCEKCWWPGG